MIIYLFLYVFLYLINFSYLCYKESDKIEEKENDSKGETVKIIDIKELEKVPSPRVDEPSEKKVDVDLKLDTEENLTEDTNKVKIAEISEKTVDIKPEVKEEKPLDDTVAVIKENTEDNSEQKNADNVEGIKQEKITVESSLSTFKKENNVNTSTLESVDKLKAMFPELEVMHKGNERDTVSPLYPTDKQTKALQLEKTFAQLIAQSYQHPIKWPKVSFSILLLLLLLLHTKKKKNKFYVFLFFYRNMQF